MQILKPCKHPNCNELVNNGAYCNKHKPKALPVKEWNRLYNTTRWKSARYHFLLSHTDCIVCGKSATEVDHIIPHRGDIALFWDSNNWQPLCNSCHSAKTAKEVNNRNNI